MSYLIILLVIAMALAPVMALRPSKAQKLQALLRDRARTLGLQVQICDFPQTHRQSVRQEDPEQGTAYRLFWRHEDAKSQQFQFLLHRDEVERNSSPDTILEALKTTLAALPDSVVAVEFSNLGVAVFWRECGDVEIVSLIAKQLQTLKAAMGRVQLGGEIVS